MKERIFSNVGWGVLSSLLYGSGRFLLFLLIARFWSSELFGMLVFSWAVVVPLSALLNLELRLVVVTDTAGRIAVGDCLHLRFFSNLQLLLALGGLCYWQFERWGWVKIQVLMLVGMVRVVESWGDILLGVLQRHERMKLAAGSHLLKFLFLGIWLLLVWSLQLSFAALLMGWMLALFVVVWGYDRWWARRFESLESQDRPRRWGRLIKAGMPLGFFMTLVYVNDGVGKYFLEGRGYGDTGVGYFGAMGIVITGLVLLQNGVNQALLPRLARYRIENRRLFWRLLLLELLGAGILGGVFFAVVYGWGEGLLRLLFQPEYGRYGVEFRVMAGAGWMLLTAMVLGDALIACQRFASRMAAVGIGAAAHIAACWWWVRGEQGLLGAAAGELLAAGITAAMCLLLLTIRREKIHNKGPEKVQGA